MIALASAPRARATRTSLALLLSSLLLFLLNFRPFCSAVVVAPRSQDEFLWEAADTGKGNKSPLSLDEDAFRADGGLDPTVTFKLDQAAESALPVENEAATSGGGVRFRRRSILETPRALESSGSTLTKRVTSMEKLKDVWEKKVKPKFKGNNDRSRQENTPNTAQTQSQKSRSKSKFWKSKQKDPPSSQSQSGRNGAPQSQHVPQNFGPNQQQPQIKDGGMFRKLADRFRHGGRRQDGRDPVDPRQHQHQQYQKHQPHQQHQQQQQHQQHQQYQLHQQYQQHQQHQLHQLHQQHQQQRTSQQRLPSHGTNQKTTYRKQRPFHQVTPNESTSPKQAKLYRVDPKKRPSQDRPQLLPMESSDLMRSDSIEVPPNGHGSGTQTHRQSTSFGAWNNGNNGGSRAQANRLDIGKDPFMKTGGGGSQGSGSMGQSFRTNRHSISHGNGSWNPPSRSSSRSSNFFKLRSQDSLSAYKMYTSDGDKYDRKELLRSGSTSTTSEGTDSFGRRMQDLLGGRHTNAIRQQRPNIGAPRQNQPLRIGSSLNQVQQRQQSPGSRNPPRQTPQMRSQESKEMLEMIQRTQQQQQPAGSGGLPEERPHSQAQRGEMMREAIKNQKWASSTDGDGKPLKSKSEKISIPPEQPQFIKNLISKYEEEKKRENENIGRVHPIIRANPKNRGGESNQAMQIDPNRGKRQSMGKDHQAGSYPMPQVEKLQNFSNKRAQQLTLGSTNTLGRTLEGVPQLSTSQDVHFLTASGSSSLPSLQDPMTSSTQRSGLKRPVAQAQSGQGPNVQSSSKIHLSSPKFNNPSTKNQSREGKSDQLLAKYSSPDQQGKPRMSKYEEKWKNYQNFIMGSKPVVMSDHGSQEFQSEQQSNSLQASNPWQEADFQRQFSGAKKEIINKYLGGQSGGDRPRIPFQDSVTSSQLQGASFGSEQLGKYLYQEPLNVRESSQKVSNKRNHGR